jgi:hypothetical protein
MKLPGHHSVNSQNQVCSLLIQTGTSRRMRKDLRIPAGERIAFMLRVLSVLSKGNAQTDGRKSRRVRRCGQPAW